MTLLLSASRVNTIRKFDFIQGLKTNFLINVNTNTWHIDGLIVEHCKVMNILVCPLCATAETTKNDNAEKKKKEKERKNIWFYISQEERPVYGQSYTKPAFITSLLQ